MDTFFVWMDFGYVAFGYRLDSFWMPSFFCAHSLFLALPVSCFSHENPNNGAMDDCPFFNCLFSCLFFVCIGTLGGARAGECRRGVDDATKPHRARGGQAHAETGESKDSFRRVWHWGQY